MQENLKVEYFQLTDQRHYKDVAVECAIALQLEADGHIARDCLHQALGRITHASGILNVLDLDFPECPTGWSVDMFVGLQRLTVPIVRQCYKRLALFNAHFNVTLNPLIGPIASRIHAPGSQLEVTGHQRHIAIVVHAQFKVPKHVS